MSSPLQYETPENVQIEYRPAGLGTRFLAWFVDSIIINFLIFLSFIALIFLAASMDAAFREWMDRLREWLRVEDKPESPETLGMYVIGIAMLVFAFGSFFYYGLSELLLRGQTLGKRMCKIRVVKADGFALDAVSVFIRNIFRVIDQMPIVWIIPFLSKQNQRMGDIVAGTIVVSDETEDLALVREQLSNRNTAEAQFRFDQAKLARLAHSDVDAVERILDRWNSLPVEQQNQFLDMTIPPLCKKMQIDEPLLPDRLVFLEDLLAAEYRRQDRHLR
jgi:uncharacterized RDD family membrane protein YckC